MENFASIANNYVQLTESLRDLNKQVKLIKDERDNVSELITQYMEKNKIDSFVLPTGDTLNLKKHVQCGSINKEYIQETLSAFFKQPLPKDVTALAEATAENIINNRENTEKNQLKIQKKK